MAKPDGKKGKKEKAKTATPVPKAVKPWKVKGPKPDFAPRAQKAPTVIVSVSDKPENIWHGYLGRVIADDMCFEITKKLHPKSSHEFRAVSVLVAHVGSELYGVAGSRVYLSIADVHAEEFRSPFKEGTPDYTRQKRMWDYFDRLFREMNLKGVHVEKAEETPA